MQTRLFHLQSTSQTRTSARLSFPCSLSQHFSPLRVDSFQDFQKDFIYIIKLKQALSLWDPTEWRRSTLSLFPGQRGWGAVKPALPCWLWAVITPQWETMASSASPFPLLHSVFVPMASTWPVVWFNLECLPHTHKLVLKSHSGCILEMQCRDAQCYWKRTQLFKM